MAALQIQTAYDSFARFKQDITDVDTDTFLDWCKWLHNFVYRYYLGIEPSNFFTTQAYTVPSSPSTQALPATFKQMDKVGAGFFLVDNDGNTTDYTLDYTGRGRSDQGYYLDGDNIVFTGMTNQSLLLVFVPKLTAITALSDYFTLDTLVTGKDIISDEWLDDFVIKALDVMYTQWDENLGAEGIADARFIRLLDEFARNIRRTPGVYALEDTSLNF
jgi:hypothetical protein